MRKLRPSDLPKDTCLYMIQSEIFRFSGPTFNSLAFTVTFKTQVLKTLSLIRCDNLIWRGDSSILRRKILHVTKNDSLFNLL